MLPSKARPNKLSLFEFDENVTLASYVPKKGKAVLVIPTMYHDATSAGDGGKPEIILHYNHTKSDIDNMDHLATMFSCKNKRNRGPWVFSTICWMLLRLQCALSGCLWTLSCSYVPEECVGAASSNCSIKSWVKTKFKFICRIQRLCIEIWLMHWKCSQNW